MNEELYIYTLISNAIFSEGIENLIQNQIVTTAKIDRIDSLEAFVNKKKSEELSCGNPLELLIYDVAKLSNKDFTHFLSLTSFNPKLKILIITSNITVGNVKLLFEIGVTGVINNNVRPEQFIKFIRKILSENKVLCPEYRDLIVEYFFNSVENKKQTKEPEHKKEDVMLFCELTNREKEILNYICDGKSTREISEELYISLHTVETHRRKILNKFGVKNTASVVKMAIKSNLYAI